MKVTKLFFLISFFALATICDQANAQFSKKKYKHAPDKTIVVIIGPSNSTFDERKFPHLRFYYLPELNTGEAPDFITRLGMKKDFDNPKRLNLLLIAKNGVVAYQNLYGDKMVETYSRSSGSDLAWSILNKPLVTSVKNPLEEYLPIYITKEKDAKPDKKKSYTEGEEPTFKDWEDGDIVGMKLPDFNVKTADGKEVAIKDVLNGKAGLIIFTGIDGTKNYSTSYAYPLPMIWHIENVLYNYYPPGR